MFYSLILNMFRDPDVYKRQVQRFVNQIWNYTLKIYSTTTCRINEIFTWSLCTYGSEMLNPKEIGNKLPWSFQMWC